MSTGTKHFLRIPPFPGHKPVRLMGPARTKVDGSLLVEALRTARVGGTFWGAQPPLPKDTIVLAPSNTAQLQDMLGRAGDRPTAVVMSKGLRVPASCQRLPDTADPWHVAASAREIWVDAGNELALVAAIAGRPVRIFGEGRFKDCDRDADKAVARHFAEAGFISPFTGEACDPLSAIALLADWRCLIDANREIGLVYGVAGWKRQTLNALLWDGSGPVRYARSVRPTGAAGQRTIAWKSRTRPTVLRSLEANGVVLGELEDGFIRSTGLGANCVPPLSVIVDLSGIYFDPATPSDLEHLLQTAEISPELRLRAERLRLQLVEAAISKYGKGTQSAVRAGGGRRAILVTGQVEDDRSIISGGSGMTNLQILERARAIEPDAYIIYKPHPDVVAGHRLGHVPATDALRFADTIEQDQSITALIDMVDAVHVITSLAGFEALLRGKSVTTHGVPFYAGWGLTRDLGPIPKRRTRKRSLDELVAATLLLYPRYLDPVTRLPCPVEVLVDRMANGQADITSPFITLRHWQGHVRAVWRQIVRGR